MKELFGRLNDIRNSLDISFRSTYEINDAKEFIDIVYYIEALMRCCYNSNNVYYYNDSNYQFYLNFLKKYNLDDYKNFDGYVSRLLNNHALESYGLYDEESVHFRVNYFEKLYRVFFKDWDNPVDFGMLDYKIDNKDSLRDMHLIHLNDLLFGNICIADDLLLWDVDNDE